MTSGDDKSLVDQALDAFVYVPLGFLLEARDLLPKMADRGRGQVALARLAGKVAQNQRSARSQQPNDSTPTQAAEVDTDALAIDGYDDLSAPQLLPDLESLDTNELEAVLAHEKSHRSRATVINKIHQLLG